MAAARSHPRVPSGLTAPDEFGDLTKKAVSAFTGKEVGEYKFGDISRTIGQKLFGNKQTKKKDK